MSTRTLITTIAVVAALLAFPVVAFARFSDGEAAALAHKAGFELTETT